MTRCIAALLLLLAVATSARATEPPEIVIGSKSFTESVILGEIMAMLTASADAQVRHRRELGGTRVLWSALGRGDIDAYPEYTGTLEQEIFAGQDIAGEAALRARLARLGIAMSPPIGFNNTYAIGMRKDQAGRLGITRISQLVDHSALKFGFGNEFMNRADGWPRLRSVYGLPQSDVRGLDHDLAYRGLAAGDIDVTDVYTTDAEIAYYDLAVLEDDRNLFPVYNAVVLYRAGLSETAPAVVAALERLEGAIDAAQMTRMNASVKLGGSSDGQVAAEFVAAKFGVQAVPRGRDALWRRFIANTAAHFRLVAISLGAAIALAVPLGVLAARRPRTGQVILGAVGLIQTIPSLALFVFMIPLLGIGGPPAVVALFLYSLLPIVRNTYTGLKDIPPSLLESADALGLSPAARLRLVELPLAARAILAGIKTSAVINVGTATLGALIGAGGYGQPILTGIRLDDIGLILEGAVPAAAFALLIQLGFEGAERLVVPRGLRLPRRA